MMKLSSSSTERSPGPLNSLRRMVFEEVKSRIYEKSADVLNHEQLSCQSCGTESFSGEHDVKINSRTQDAIWFCDNPSCINKINRIVLGVADEEISQILRTLINSVSVNPDFSEEEAARDPQGTYSKILEAVLGDKERDGAAENQVLAIVKRAVNLSTSPEEITEVAPSINVPAPLERDASLEDIVRSLGFVQRITMKQIPIFIRLGKSEEVFKGVDAVSAVVSKMFKFLNAGRGADQARLLFEELKKNFKNAEVSELIISLIVWKKSIELGVDTLPISKKDPVKDGALVSRPEATFGREEVTQQLSGAQQAIESLIKLLSREY